MTIKKKDRKLLEAVKKVGYQEGETFFGGRAVNDIGLETVQSLIRNGANVNMQDEGNGSTPLIHAIQNCNFKIADFLISSGADVNLPNRAGVSPLHMAAMVSTKAVSFLLEKGADYSLKTKDGVSIIEWAEQNNLTGAIETIMAWKNRPQKKNNPMGFLKKLFGERKITERSVDAKQSSQGAKKLPDIFCVVTDVPVEDPGGVGNSVLDKYDIEIGLDTAVLVVCNNRVVCQAEPDLSYFMAIAMRIAKDKGWPQDKINYDKIVCRRFTIDSPQRTRGYIMTV